MSDSTTITLRTRIDQLQSHIWELEKQKKQIDEEIACLEKELFHKCNHNWVKEPDTWSDELVDKRCTKCMLYNYRY